MPRFLAIFLTASFLISPFSAFANMSPEEEAGPAAASPEVPLQSIPVYLFADENGSILCVTPIAEDLTIWAYATSTEYVEIGLINPMRLASESIASTEVEKPPMIPLGVLLVPLDANGDTSAQISGNGAGVGQRIFTGYEHDYSTGLNYAVARYQNPSQGRFVSQDPVFMEVGGKYFANKLQGSAFGSANVKNKQELIERYLATPQALNSYSYSLNNPLIYRDENGEIVALAPIVAGGAIGALGGFGSQYLDDVRQNIGEGRSGIGVLAFRSSAKEYGLSIVSGAGAGAVAAIATPLALIGAGGISVAGSLGQDYISGKRYDVTQAVVEGVTTTVAPLAVNQAFGKVVGRNVSTFSKYLIQGAHTQRDIAAEALQTQVNYIANVVRDISATVELLKTKQPL